MKLGVECVRRWNRSALAPRHDCPTDVEEAWRLETSSTVAGGSSMRCKSFRLLHVRQKVDCDCVVAAIATMACKPYEKVAAVSPAESGERPLRPDEILRLLHEATGIPWRGPNWVWLRRTISLASSSMPLLIVNRRPWKPWIRHCIAVHDGTVYDPEFNEPSAASDYERREWRVLQVYQASDYDKLKILQQSVDEQEKRQ